MTQRQKGFAINVSTGPSAPPLIPEDYTYASVAVTNELVIEDIFINGSVGSLIVSGGLGVSGNINVGPEGALIIDGSSTALVTAGGIAADRIYVNQCSLLDPTTDS